MFQNSKLFRFVRYQWRTFWSCIIAIFLIALLVYTDTRESRCAYVMLLMATFWVLEPIPLPATSLMPVALFPLLGVTSTADICKPYLHSTIMMFVGGLLMAIAIEHCNLHKKIALNVLLRMGASAPQMMLGFMATSMFLSMWISNTATAALMVPIIDAIMVEIETHSSSQSMQDRIDLKTISVVPILPKPTEENGSTFTAPESPVKVSEPPPSSYRQCPSELPKSSLESSEAERMENKKSSAIRHTLFLSVAYATNIGGTGTITGTGPNLIVTGIVEEYFPQSNELSYDKWMLYNVPVMLICVGLAWCYLYFVRIRKATPTYSDEFKKKFKQIIMKREEELGPLNFQQKTVAILFAILVMLWLFRNPRFIKGWGSFFTLKVQDATPAILMPLLLFLIPANPWHISRSPALLDWKTVHTKMPWGIIILLGGGFALAEGSKQSGLSLWASHQLASLSISSPLAIVTILCLLATTLTEFTSNVAIANIVVPVVAQLAVVTQVNPIYYVLPVGVCCSFAFMLPVATPPNAIAYEASGMRTIDMVKPGFLMNLMCILVELFMLNTLGNALFDFNHFPQWANITLGTANTVHS